ncbi:MAG: hypothetical protein ACR2JE_11055 [Acidobacteriaceae bacterium]
MNSTSSKVPDQPTIATVYSAYTQIWQTARRHLGGRIPGRFFLCSPLSEGGTSLTLATGIAGAASLTIEPSSDAIRDATRAGIVDFAVNTLDEALRILKNEIRKQQAVSVLLEGGVAQALAEMGERGAQPDLIAWYPSDDRRLAPFLERGAVLLSSSAGTEEASAGAEEPSERDREDWLPVSWRTLEPSAQALRYLDSLVVNTLPEDDLERRHWVARAPRYLPRVLRTERSVAMTPDEATRFRAAVERAVAAGELSTAAELQIGHGAPMQIVPPRPGAPS